jgi:NADH-quinone oxidoreductase subunit N
MDIYVPKILTEISQLWPIIVLFLAIGMILLAEITLDARLVRMLRGVIISFCLLAAMLTSFNFLIDPAIDFMDMNLLAGGIVPDRIFLFGSMFLSLCFLAIFIVSEALTDVDQNRSIFLCLLLAGLAGTILIGATRHLVVLLLAVELASLPIYALVARPSSSSTCYSDVGLRYILTGMFCSAVTALGVSLLYAVAGSFHFQKIALRISIGGIEPAEIFALVCLAAGIAFKLMLVPLARAGVDVIASVRIDLGIWLVLAGATAGLAVLARFIQILAWFADDSFNAGMAGVLAIIFGITILAGSVGAFRSSSVKRLLAWSSVVHIASMAMGLLIWSDRSGLASILVYLIIFALATVGVFSIAGLVERSFGTDRLESFVGMSYKNPFLAVVMTVLLLSLVGVPPLAGFIAKWNLFTALWTQELSWSALGILAASFLSIFYYLRIVRAMYSKPMDLIVIKIPSPVAVIVGGCAIGCFALFFLRNLLINLSYSLLTSFWG